MDFNKLITRVKNILLTPKTEWPVIAGETETVQGLYVNYILILAALTPIATFIGLVLFGIHVPLLGTFHVGIGTALTQVILSYIMGLVMTFIMALIIDALATTFGGQKNQIQALKTTAYAFTAVWVVGILNILPGLGALVVLLTLVAAIYAIYLLYLGLPQTMKCPQDKAGGYAAVVIIIGFVIGFVFGMVVGSMSGMSSITHGAMSSDFHLGDSSPNFTPDNSSALGKLAAIGQKMGEAGQKMEAAQKTGDANAQAQAAGQMLGTVLGGGSQVEALAPDAIKAFVPDTLAGLKRTSVSAERNGAMGMQVSAANATYSDGQHTLHLEIADSGSAKGIMALAGAVNVESDNETDHGYDKTYKQDGRLVHEQWNTQSKYGEFSIVLGDRFSVKVSGNADSIDQLKAAVGSINLAGLEALKNQGVKSQ
ncbi:MAG: Yip1 family protein [Rudaea sp.]